MNTAIKELTIEEKSIAMIAPKAEAIRVGDDDCFAPVVAKVVRKKKPQWAYLNEQCGELTYINTVTGETIEVPMPNWVYDLGNYVGSIQQASEAANMLSDLATLRAGEVEPVVTMDAETLDAIENEHIGAEFSTTPYLY